MTYTNLRPKTLRVLAERENYDPHNDRFGAVCPPEPGLTGPVYSSIAYASQDVDSLAAIFSGTKRGFVYPRISENTPPIRDLADRLLELELGHNNPQLGQYDAILTCSGMAAIMILMLQLADRGGSIISSPYMYGGTFGLFTQYLPRLGIKVHFIKNPRDLLEWDQACKDYPEAVCLYAEDDANPTPFKLDNSAIAEIAHRYGKIYVCDRTVGTPITEQPLLDGTDVVVHSLSKNISGYSWALGGTIIARKELCDAIRGGWFQVMGPVLDSRAADRILAGLETLESRMRVKIKSAQSIAKFLKSHPMVENVYGPGGDLLAFEIHGEFESAKKVVENYKLILMAPHLGDIRTLSIHPASTTHAAVPPADRLRLGITDTLIRLSVGLEDFRDIIDDLRQSLDSLRT